MNKNSGTSGLGLSSVLTIIFVVLKLIGAIDWGWWWVFSPTLISVGLWLIVVAVLGIYAWHIKRKYTPPYLKKRNRF